MNATYAQAVAAAQTLHLGLGEHPAVNGIGVTQQDEGFIIKVSLIDAVPEGTIPLEVDGVLVVVQVIGEIEFQKEEEEEDDDKNSPAAEESRECDGNDGDRNGGALAESDSGDPGW